MDIQELKSKIESNEVSDKFMIFVCADDTSRIITDQYIDLISSNKGLTKTYISNLDEIQDAGFIIDTHLYILNTDTWESTNTHDNCIVVCNKSIQSDYSIAIPKLQDWQLKDFISPTLHSETDVGISDRSIKSATVLLSHLFVPIFFILISMDKLSSAFLYGNSKIVLEI